MSVNWTSENIGKNAWLVRNTGSETATSVTIDPAAVGDARIDFTPQLPTDIAPGRSLEIRAIGGWGAHIAHEAELNWGHGQTAIVPLP